MLIFIKHNKGNSHIGVPGETQIWKKNQFYMIKLKIIFSIISWLLVKVFWHGMLKVLLLTH